MESLAHTPGPWTATRYKHLPRFKVDGANDGYFLADVYDGNGAHPIEANAALIAAAPDLLEALLAIEAGFRDGSIKFAKKRWADSDPYHPANTLMCDAIAKATATGGAR